MHIAVDGRAARRLDFLDGLRGWAALVVVFYHVTALVFPPIALMPHLIPFLPWNGVLAVTLFFLISGFALTIPYLQRSDRRVLVALAAGRFFGW